MFRTVAGLAAGLALAAGLTLTAAVEPELEAANAAVEYITSLQNPDGGFPAFGEESSPGATLDAVFALVAAEQDPLEVTRDGNSPADYLAANADTYSVDAGAAAKLMLGVVAMGLDHRDFGGLDLPSVLEGHLAEDPSTGVYGLDLFDQALYILALAAAGEPIRPAPVDYLRSLQQDDGGWEFSPGDGSDSNTTAMALQALLATGVAPADPAVAAALDYLHTVQNADGGFGFLLDADSDPNTTALVVQALVAAGEDIGVGGPWAPGGITPLEALRAFQNPDTGAFQFAGEDSPFATYQAVPALMLAPFPDLETRLLPASPTPVASATPAATATSPATATETPSLPTPAALPSTGAAPSDGGSPWWALAVLLAGGSTAVAVGIVRRRAR